MREQKRLAGCCMLPFALLFLVCFSGMGLLLLGQGWQDVRLSSHAVRRPATSRYLPVVSPKSIAPCQ